jgi:hypothetical protein
VGGEEWRSAGGEADIRHVGEAGWDPLMVDPSSYERYPSSFIASRGVYGLLLEHAEGGVERLVVVLPRRDGTSERRGADAAAGGVVGELIRISRQVAGRRWRCGCGAFWN